MVRDAALRAAPHHEGLTCLILKEAALFARPSRGMAASACLKGVYAMAREDGRKRPDALRRLCIHPSRRIAYAMLLIRMR